MVTDGLLYIYAPMCGTCAVAERMLTVVEAIDPKLEIEKRDANFIPKELETYQVMSVPALLKLENGRVIDRMYAFHNVQHVLSFVQ
ncbi:MULTISPECIES: thioredoxin family protein [Exiguobacterium]|uniref:thioredoxin family protein n=1 Tax=Exiguobacterium TaxID=33986 RepID=UPI001BEB8907|nr:MULTISPECIES: thioredoxin family protein [Exiguobacterium]MCT4782136.1 thioredoxin family protein [Exiguobacterium himgiriensis]